MLYSKVSWQSLLVYRGYLKGWSVSSFNTVCTLAENDSVPLTSSKPTPETAPKGASNRRIVPLCDANDVSNPKVTYTYEMKNGWICRCNTRCMHLNRTLTDVLCCRVPIKKSPETDFGLKLSDCQPPSKRRKKVSQL